MIQENKSTSGKTRVSFPRYFTGIILFSGLFFILSSCAESVTLTETIAQEPVGFLHGLLHGVILPISFIVSLFDADVAIYAIYNTGGWYDFGFLLGASASIGGGSKATG